MPNALENLRFRLALGAGKAAAAGLAALKRAGGQLPGVIAERIDPAFLAHIGKPDRIVFVTGTNGKTTTANLLDDLLADNGFDLVTNRAGSNTINGIESSLIKNARLSGKQRKQVACMELDELSSRRVLPHVVPDLLLVCNLYRDSFMRNANPDYIFDVLSSSISPATELILNADDLISCRLAPQARKRTYFSIGRLPDDTGGPQGIVCDLTACPECGSALAYDYCHLRHLGKARCVRCGFANPEPDFEVTRVDCEAGTFTVRENREPGAPEHDYRIAAYSITNLYNLLAAVVTARRLGIGADAIAASLEKGINITALRYSVEAAKGVWLVNVAAKGENSTATSTAIQTICREPGRKAVALIMSDYYLATSPYSSEYTGWYYQTDFEYLADPSVGQIVVVGARGEDLLLRLMLAGVDAMRVSLVADADAAARELDLEDAEGVFIAYDIFNGDQADRLRSLMRERIEENDLKAAKSAGTPAPTPAVPADQGAGCVVEVLYPEFGNQAGDNGNALYLRACLPGATFIETAYGDEPAFAARDVSAIVMGSMTEAHQQLAAAALLPYADRLAQLADAGIPMLFTHSAAELLGSSFGTPDGRRKPGLGVLDFSVRLDMPKRYLCSTVGSFDPADGGDPVQILGFKIQFTQMQAGGTAGSCKPFCTLNRGWGLAEQNPFEGFLRGGLIATWILGPLLPTNPDFARWFCEKITGSAVVLPFEREARAAYRVRAAELTRPLPKGKAINP
ncbi:DUF1727 domain-containing protein [Coriobacteriales bacterium OH1046]|nr:DUF1727 domain-containing protein [Coriobacteriales bacterium OH1046]